MRGWEWDETLFSGAARYYEAGRLPYAPGLGAGIRSVAPDPGHGRLLDVGCGPGSVCLRAAAEFDQVIGVDADPGMVAEATRLATEQVIGNATFVHCRAEQLPAGLGRFDVITFAQSFHWMDRSLVAGTVATMLTGDGIVIHVDTVHAQRADRPHPEPPTVAVRDLVHRYLGPGRRAGRSIRETSPSGENDIFRAAGFTGPQEVLVPDGRLMDRSIDQAVAAVFSMSSSAPHLFRDRVGDFERDLRELLSASTPSGCFSLVAPDMCLKVWRL